MLPLHVVEILKQYVPYSIVFVMFLGEMFPQRPIGNGSSATMLRLVIQLTPNFTLCDAWRTTPRVDIDWNLLWTIKLMLL